MVLTIIISLLILVVIVILITPVHLYINTDLNTFKIFQSWWISLGFRMDEEELLLMDFSLVGIRFKPKSLMDKLFAEKKKKSKKPAKKRSLRKWMSPERIIKIFKEFEVKEFDLNIDTGDPVRNAKLYPLFELLNYRYGGFRLNFLGYNRLIMNIQGRPIKFLKIFVTQ